MIGKPMEAKRKRTFARFKDRKIQSIGPDGATANGHGATLEQGWEGRVIQGSLRQGAHDQW
jgi:hypothetical protein